MIENHDIAHHYWWTFPKRRESTCPWIGKLRVEISLKTAVGCGIHLGVHDKDVETAGSASFFGAVVFVESVRFRLRETAVNSWDVVGSS